MDDKTYVEGIFSGLFEITRAFNFFGEKKEPEGETQEEQHRRRLLDLITDVRKMAKKKFRQMPGYFRAVHTEDYWVHEAMVTLWSESIRYEPKDGYYYNKYMVGIVSKRLISLQRSIFRENPPVYEGLRKLIASKRRELKREPTHEEISHLTGRSLDDVCRVLSEGVGTTRRIARATDATDLNEWSEERAGRPGASPEDAYLKKEFRMIVLECLDKMRPYDRYVVVQHYFMGLSFPDISKITLEGVETARTQCWRAFGQLRDCVLDRYEIRTLQ